MGVDSSSAPPSGFRLSAHEVMRGIKVDDGRLILRPSGGFQLATITDGALGMGILPVAVANASRSGMWWLLLGPFSLALIVDALARTRVRVSADQHKIQVRNKWRTLHVPLSQVNECRSEIVRWRIKAPWFAGRRSQYPFSAEPWLVGTVVTHEGVVVIADALMGLPPSGALMTPPPPEGGTFDPVVDYPVAMKAAALARWCSVPCRHLAEKKTGRT